jgi:hypothetical protein
MPPFLNFYDNFNIETCVCLIDRIGVLHTSLREAARDGCRVTRDPDTEEGSGIFSCLPTLVVSPNGDGGHHEDILEAARLRHGVG